MINNFKIILTLFLAVFLILPDSHAANLKYDVTKGEYRRRDDERQYLVGKVVNIAYELQHQAGGADSQDALFSKGRQGILTSGGQIWTIVDNIKGQEIQWNKDLLGKYIKILGWVFHEAQYIEVDRFEFDGKEYAWDGKKNTFLSEESSETKG